MSHGKVGLHPVAEYAESLKFFPLNAYIFTRIFPAEFPFTRCTDLFFFGAEVFIYLKLYGQAVAVPSGHIRGIKSLHRPVFDDHVLEDLVKGVTDMNIAVGIRRAVMENVSLIAPVLLLDTGVNVVLFPELEHLRLLLPEVGLHGKVCLW